MNLNIFDQNLCSIINMSNHMKIQTIPPDVIILVVIPYNFLHLLKLSFCQWMHLGLGENTLLLDFHLLEVPDQVDDINTPRRISLITTGYPHNQMISYNKEIIFFQNASALHCANFGLGQECQLS